MEHYSQNLTDNYFSNREWLQARLGRFTASEIHKILGKGRDKSAQFSETGYTYIRTKAAEILTQEVKEDINFKQAEWGKSNEAEAHQLFEKVSGIKGSYYGAGNPKFFPFGDYEGASPDWESEDETIGADFKCPYNSAEHVLNLTINSAAELAEERKEYYSQLQHTMYRRGWKVAYFVSYDPRMALDHQKLKVITVHPDQEWRKKFDEKIALAVDELKSIINKVMTADFALVSYDAHLSTMVVSPEKLTA